MMKVEDKHNKMLDFLEGSRMIIYSILSGNKIATIMIE